MKSFHQKKTRSFSKVVHVPDRRLCIYDLHFSDLKTWVPLGVWLRNHQAFAPNTSSDFPRSPLQGLMHRQRCHKRLLPESCSLLISLFWLHKAVDAKPGCFHQFCFHHWVHPSRGTCMSPAGLILPQTNQTSDAARSIGFEKCFFSK